MQKARSSPGSLTWVAEIQTLESLTANFPDHCQGAAAEMEQLGHKLESLWDAGITGGDVSTVPQEQVPDHLTDLRLGLAESG